MDHYSTWRRPILQPASATTVSVQSGLDGTSGNIPILFPDGSVRTETSTTRTTFNITRNAVLVTSGAQSGLTGATSEANNTWYALYAVKVTDSSTLWVTVGSTVFPSQANYATLNTAYGTSGWVYLGAIRNGDNSATAGDILSFRMAGNFTQFYNTATGNAFVGPGIRIATTASATSLTYSYTVGTGAAEIPDNIRHLLIRYAKGGGGAGDGQVDYGAATSILWISDNTVKEADQLWTAYGNDIRVVSGASSVGMDIFLNGFVDMVLGVGSNPLL